MCSGYYSYKGGYRPDFPGEERFGGTFVHPQQWPDDLDYQVFHLHMKSLVLRTLGGDQHHFTATIGFEHGGPEGLLERVAITGPDPLGTTDHRTDRQKQDIRQLMLQFPSLA